MLKVLLFFSFLFTIFLHAEESPDIHGWVDVAFKNDYITPRGLLVSNTGLTTQILAVLSLDLSKCENYNVTLTAGIWNDVWSAQHDPKVGSWNECDWFAGFIIGFCKNFKFSAQYVEFLSPPGHFKAEKNAEFGFFYDDRDWVCLSHFTHTQSFFGLLQEIQPLWSVKEGILSMLRSGWFLHWN